MKTVFLCGGQGSFIPGMGREPYERNPAFRNALDTIGNLLEEDIPHLYWGPGRTRVKGDPYLSHVALWATSYALHQSLCKAGLYPDILMGHSLGEVIAFCLSGAFPLLSACQLIKGRGRLFAENKQRAACDLHAVLGEPTQIDQFMIANEVGNTAYPANYNTPRQVVFAVSDDGLEQFQALVRSFGLRSVCLQVGNGCHSPHVAEINAPLQKILDDIPCSRPETPVFSCLNSTLVQTSSEVYNVLSRQLLSSVYWARSLDHLHREWIDCRLVDLAFSNTVKGLVKGWNPTAVLLDGQELVGESLNV